MRQSSYYDFVCDITFEAENTPQQGCGVLLSPQHLLTVFHNVSGKTSGHCIIDPSENYTRIDEVIGQDESLDVALVTLEFPMFGQYADIGKLNADVALKDMSLVHRFNRCQTTLEPLQPLPEGLHEDIRRFDDDQNFIPFGIQLSVGPGFSGSPVMRGNQVFSMVSYGHEFDDDQRSNEYIGKISDELTYFMGPDLKRLNCFIEPHYSDILEVRAALS